MRMGQAQGKAGAPQHDVQQEQSSNQPRTRQQRRKDLGSDKPTACPSQRARTGKAVSSKAVASTSKPFAAQSQPSATREAFHDLSNSIQTKVSAKCDQLSPPEPAAFGVNENALVSILPPAVDCGRKRSQPPPAATRSKKRQRCSEPPTATSSPLLSLPPGVVDIDAGDRRDAQLCAEYNETRMAWLRAQERLERFRLSPEAVLGRQDPAVIGAEERALLVDWLAGRARDCRLHDATLHRAVSLLDRGLAAVRVATALEGETLAAAALHAAVKLEEVEGLALRDVRRGLHTDCLPAAIVAMEARLAAALAFALHAPTPHCFLLRALKAAGAAPGSRAALLATYLAELAVHSAHTLRFEPSTVAAAAVALSVATLRRPGGWSPTLAHACGGAALEGALAAAVAHLAALQRAGCGAGVRARGALWRRYGCAESMHVAAVVALGEEEVAAFLAKSGRGGRRSWGRAGGGARWRMRSTRRRRAIERCCAPCAR
ncbi:hypothetical protein JKP88DRAFT_304196 [Tribonema minus]|uniref:Uncharacterized protein n=1 Tax=Tribonema minus TaxID=303371 RepID=A0A835ZDR1_9STRA|nr:hypothetical protein JKP88DRAFT_304196 [Tribonema minus]